MCAVWTSALPRCGMHRYLVQRCYSTERGLSALCVFPAGCKIWSPSEWVQTSCQKTPESSCLFDIINCSEWFDLWTRLCGVKEDLEQEDSNNIEQASEAGKLAFRPPLAFAPHISLFPAAPLRRLAGEIQRADGFKTCVDFIHTCSLVLHNPQRETFFEVKVVSLFRVFPGFPLWNLLGKLFSCAADWTMVLLC